MINRRKKTDERRKGEEEEIEGREQEHRKIGRRNEGRDGGKK